MTYTLGQMSGANNSNLPAGNTYEDSAYTRYLKEILNVQNENAYMEREDRYDEYVNVLVNDHTLPDVLVVSDRETLNVLVENDMVEDLTEVYANCTSPRIKAMYNSYGPQLLGAGTFDGKLMALPEAVIDHGPCLLWMRKDWMDQLGLAEPKTLEEAMDIIQVFRKTGWEQRKGKILWDLCVIPILCLLPVRIIRWNLFLKNFILIQEDGSRTKTGKLSMVL